MSQLKLRALTPAFGAEVEGFETSSPLDEEVLAQLRAAFDERSVLVFRNLDIEEDMQRSIVYGLIGEEVPVELAAAEKRPRVVSNKMEHGAAPYGRLLFHCDNMWARRFERILSLYGVQVEPPSAPTTFVSMGETWDRLPEELRARLEGLEARHGFEHKYPNRGGDQDVIDAYYDTSRSTVRPVIVRHPRTGRMLLYVSQQATIEILGLSAEENEALLAELFSYLYEPSTILAHEWRTGDLVVWDNITAQHGRGTVTLDGPERTLRKVGGPFNLDPDEVNMPVFQKAAGK
jgi:alpha-ketoglutarate-dependent taurine dioxygenase